MDTLITVKVRSDLYGLQGVNIDQLAYCSKDNTYYHLIDISRKNKRDGWEQVSAIPKNITTNLGYLQLSDYTVSTPLFLTDTNISILQSGLTQNGYLSSIDWNIFNNKQTALNGLGFIKANGTTITYDNSTYLTDAIISLNNLTATVQTFAIGTTGTSPNWSSVTSTHTLHIPMASVDTITAGLLSHVDYDIFSNKQNALNSTEGLSFVKANGTTISYDLNTYSLSNHDHTGVYEPHDDDLTAIAALGFTSASFLKKTALDTWELDTNTYSLSNHDHSGTYEPHDDDLTAIAALGFTSNSFLIKTAANTWSLDTNTYSLSNHDHSGTYEPHDDDLTAIAALGYTSTSFLTKTAANTWTLDTNVYIIKSGDTGVGLLYFATNQGIDAVATIGSDVLNIGTANADTINIGWSGATVNIQGTVLYQQVANLQVTDKLITLNKGGAIASGTATGFEIEENNAITGWFTTSGTRDGWEFRSPAMPASAIFLMSSISEVRTYTWPNASGTVALTSNLHNAVTLATDHGLSLSTQVLSMGTPSSVTTSSTNSVTTTTHTHAITGFQTSLNGTGFVKISGTTISYDNSTYSLSTHTHTGSAFSLLNDEWLETLDYAGNTANLIKYSKDNIIEFGAPVSINAFYHVLNSGVNDIVNIPVSEISTDGTEHGVGITIGGVQLLKVSALSDGAGGIDTHTITAVGNLLFTDNTYDIGASGATRPRTGYFGTSVITPALKITTGAAAGNMLISDADGDLSYLAAGATTTILIGGGAANPVWGTNIPTAITIGSQYIYRVAGTDVSVADGGTGVSTFALNGVLYGNAANAVGVTAIGAEGQILRVGASPFVPAWSTATYPNTTTAYQLLVSTGTNVIGGLTVGATGKLLMGSSGAVPIWTTPTYPNSATANKILVGDGTNIVLSTPTFPNASATTRKIIVSDGTNWIASTETYAVPGNSGNVMLSDGTNWTSVVIPNTHVAATVTTTNGLSISGQEISLGVASTNSHGALTDTDWNIFNGKQAALTFGIADTNKVQINSATVTNGEYAKFTATGLESRSVAEVLNDISAAASGHNHDGVYEPHDDDLTAIAALGYASTSFLKKTAANTWALDTATYLTSVTAHNLLSATHGDTLTDTVIRGDILYGNATPKWARLAFPATPTGKVLIASATDITWSASALGTAAYTASTAYAAALSGTINEIAYFNSTTTIASLAVATYPSLTELSYVKGVTSALQTQLGNKQASNAVLTELTALTDPGANGVVIWNDTSNNFEFLSYANWNTAYSWGNHAVAGYLSASSYTAADVLVKIKTVDGTGSGLDADLLDGHDTAYFQVAGTYSTDIHANITALNAVTNTNTGDNATNSQYSGLVTNATHSGDATGATALTLATVNSNVGTYNNITINAKGLATAGSNVAYLTTVDISANTNLAVTAPIVLTGDTVSITQSTTTTHGYLSSTNFNIFNNKQNTLINDQWLTAYDYAGNVVNLLKVSKDNLFEFGIPVGINALYHVLNSGLNDIVDIPVSALSSDNTEHGIGITVGGTKILKVSALSDGAGGIDNKLITVDGGLHVGGTSAVSDNNVLVDGTMTSTGGGFNSLRSLKSINEDWSGNAINTISEFKIRDFYYKDTIGFNRTLGFIIDECPKSIEEYVLFGENRESINLYSLHALSFKAHQETQLIYQEMREEIKLLYKRIKILENRRTI